MEETGAGLVIDSKAISEIFIGEKGIKSIVVGNRSVYERTGGYIYLTLKTEEKE